MLFRSIMLANQSGYCTSQTDLALKSFPTSSRMASCHSGAIPLLFCLTGWKLESKLSRWDITWGSILGMSSWLQAKTSWFCRRNRVSSAYSSRREPMLTTLSGSCGFRTIWMSSSTRLTPFFSPLGFISSIFSASATVFLCREVT